MTAAHGNEIERARDALRHCDPGCARDEWVKLAMACKAAWLDFDTFDAWSARAQENYSKRDTAAVWRSIKHDDGIGPGTLFAAAAAAGWNPEQKHARMNGTAKHRGTADDVWARCEPATSQHGYIITKQGTPEGLRVVPAGDPLTIAKQRMAGALVVPVRTLDDALVSLQFIPAAGTDKKLNLPGAPMAGVFIVGALQPGNTAYIVEGIGAGWSCWKATGRPAVVCFGWGRVRGVAAELRKRDPAARLVVVPDVGKERDAEAIARDVGGSFVALPDGWPQNADVNDFTLREGHDALEALLAAPLGAKTRFKLLTARELAALPPMAWLVRGLFPARGIAAIFGPTKSGKSFLAFDLATAIAEARDWFGHRVEKRPVAYVVLEGEAGFGQRVAAWEQHHKRPAPEGVRFVVEPLKLLHDVAALAVSLRSLGEGAVVFIDTLNAAAPGIDENTSRDMGLIIEAAKELARLTGGLVVLIAHTGKDEERGLRGHSSQFAALDGAIQTTRTGDRRTWTTAKVKDAADGEAHAFRLHKVRVGTYEDGEPIGSCVVEPDESQAEVARVKLPQGGNQRIILEALRPMFRAAGSFGKGGAPAQRPCVELETAIEAARERLTCPPDKRTNRTRQVITGLIASGVLGCNEGWIWLR